MRLLHEPADDPPADADREPNDDPEPETSGAPASRETTLAGEVEVADSLVARARGLMFRRSIPDDYALAFPFERAKTRDVHMLFVRVPIDVLWVVDGTVRQIDRLRPWRGFARAPADLIVELPAGAADDVTVGDRISLAERA